MIYDVTGAITYVLCAAFSYLARDQTGHVRAHIATLLVVLWAARLGTFLFLRIRKDGEDKRFRRIRNDPVKFFVVWMMQGLWICIVSLPLWLLNLGSNALPVAPVEYIGLAVWIFGFALEVAADTQKSTFRADRRNANKFITTGVWAWSRHPNYLGEILLWFGLYLFVAPALEGWQHVAILSPTFTAFLLTRVSGVPLLERHADATWGENPEYRRYKANTAVLVPFVW